MHTQSITKESREEERHAVLFIHFDRENPPDNFSLSFFFFYVETCDNFVPVNYGPLYYLYNTQHTVPGRVVSVILLIAIVGSDGLCL